MGDWWIYFMAKVKNKNCQRCPFQIKVSLTTTTTQNKTKTQKAARKDLNLPFELIYLAEIKNQAWYYNQEFIWSSCFSFCFQFYSQLIWLRNFQVSRRAFLLRLSNTFIFIGTLPLFLVHFQQFSFCTIVPTIWFWKLTWSLQAITVQYFLRSIKPDTEIIFEIKWDLKSQNCLTS